MRLSDASIRPILALAVVVGGLALVALLAARPGAEPLAASVLAVVGVVLGWYFGRGGTREEA